MGEVVLHVILGEKLYCASSHIVSLTSVPSLVSIDPHLSLSRIHIHAIQWLSNTYNQGRKKLQILPIPFLRIQVTALLYYYTTQLAFIIVSYYTITTLSYIVNLFMCVL